MRKIQIAPLSQMANVRKLLNDYLKELSQYDNTIKFDKNNNPIYQWFECYWDEYGRYPFYFFVNDKIAGFSLVRQISHNELEIAEFYVLPEYRRDNNAMWFAQSKVDLFYGQFDFSTTKNNIVAVKFWNKFAQQFIGYSYWETNNRKNLRCNWTIRKINNKTHKMNLLPQYFDMIKSGEKTLEGRLNDKKRKNMQIGDTIIFYKEPERKDKIYSVLLDKYYFDNFDDMAKQLDKNKLGFSKSTKKEMVATYRRIYSKNDEKKYGVVILKIKTI